jgi:hypothetical protein
VLLLLLLLLPRNFDVSNVGQSFEMPAVMHRQAASSCVCLDAYIQAPSLKLPCNALQGGR